METIRFIRLPKCKAITSGYAYNEEPFQKNGKLELFDSFWSKLDQSRVDNWYSRDYLMYGREQDAMIWYYAVPDDFDQDVSPWEVVELEGGLYACAAANAGSFKDEQQVYGEIKKYIADSERFILDERENHYDLCTVMTPSDAAEALGYSQIEIMVPVRIAEPDSLKK
ncbi:hypothetical protein [Candidatus Enterococcus clewellii]|uniref:Bacterial transcription activator effector binding domain-containing protein n=1 Tax=Candidatus Enterococcus clewellii TaxID=1834193 RepID=A0A242JYZ1_9ENTE|nr:hypothetical protein [Enterococcus sp. 9E7_DIV0242]OTP10539.1 hypothetical protein A5888_003837 [Enterococcus sp. 9E7_DIV0242]